VVIGGTLVPNNRHTSSVEIISFGGRPKTCQHGIPDFPYPLRSASAVYFQGKLIVCGGWNGKHSFDKCFSFSKNQRDWMEILPLSDKSRHSHSSSVIDGNWFISGGSYRPKISSSSTLKSTLIFKERFNEGPKMPLLRTSHCQITINATHVFIAGGSKRTILFDWTRQQWIFLEDCPYSLSYATCGLLNNPNIGPEVLIASGSRSYLFSFQNLTWREAPQLPLIQTYTATNVHGCKGVLAVGGRVSNKVIDSIYRFSEERYEWIMEGAHLETPREMATSLVVPDDFLDCQ